jgi:hypothetical protein
MNTLNQFAWQLGAHARITQAHSLVWHKAYVKATPETQAAWRADFIVHFLRGNLEVTEAQAKAIMGKSRTDRSTAHQNAYRAAEMKFNYHIRRKSSGDAEPAKPTRTTAAEKAAFARFLAAFDGDVKRLKAVVKALA